MTAALKKTRLSPGWVLLLLMGLALAVRILSVLAHPMVQADETAYLRIAENIAGGRTPYEISGLFTTQFTLILPVLIAGFTFITGDFITAGYVVVTLFGVLLLIPVFLLGKAFAGTRAGLMAAALMAVFPIFVGTSEYIYTETIYIFFLLMAAFFAWQMLQHQRVPCSIFTGLCLGLAYLANPLAVYYVVAFTVVAVAVAWRKRSWLVMFRSVALLLLFFLLLASPYVIFLHHELGRWTYTGKQSYGHNYFAATHGFQRGTLEWEKEIMALTDDGREVRALSLKYDSSPLGDIIHEPLTVARVFARQSYVFYSSMLYKVFPLWLLPLLGLGLFATGWSRRRLAEVGFLLLLMLPVLPILAMIAFQRFFMPYLPVALIWVAQGWERLESWGQETVSLSFSEARQRRLQGDVLWVIAAMVMLPLIAFAGFFTLSQDYATGYRDAGEWIRDHAGKDRKILYRETTAYYAGGTMVALPYADYDSTTAFARGKDVDYLAIRRKDILEWRPGLAVLLEPDYRHPEWELVYSSGSGGDEMLVFRLVR